MDPVGSDNFRKLYSDELNYCSSIEDAISNADICFILTEWKEIKEFDLDKFTYLMKKPIVIDGRNCYELNSALEANIIYDSIGRKCVLPN